MNGLVVDNSVVAKWVLPEADTAAAKRIVTAAKRNVHLVVLDIAFPEVTNAIWSRHRRGLISRAQAERAFQALRQSPVKTEPALDLLEPALRSPSNTTVQFTMRYSWRSLKRRAFEA